MNKIWDEIKIASLVLLSLVYEKPKPMWISVSLYGGDELIEIFKVCPQKGRVVMSETRSHRYKIKIEVI